jgi:capsular polysaccharide biosynthesis protein
VSGHDPTRPDGRQPASGNPAPWVLPDEADGPSRWDDQDFVEEAPDEPLRPIDALVSFHYLRAAVRRSRRFVAGLALVGMLLGAAFLLLVPTSHTARIAILLGYGDGADPSRARSTDVALLDSETVAERTARALGLPMTPQDLRASISVTPSTSDVLVLTASASTDAEAVSRLSTFAKIYLDFRGTQTSAQSDFMIKGYEQRIAALQANLSDLDRRIRGLTGEQLNDALTRRTQISAQISGLQESSDAAALRKASIVYASRVIDPARPQPSGQVLRLALAVLSGLVGGTALAFGIVVLRALLSDRLRLRVEVASALDAPVTVSVGRLAPAPRLQRMLQPPPWRTRRRRRHHSDLARAGLAIGRGLTSTNQRRRLVVVCVENAGEGAIAVVAAARELGRHGQSVSLVDVSEAGALQRAVARTPAQGPAGEALLVSRPADIPSLSSVPAEVDPKGTESPQEGRDGDENPCLVLADLDPAIGADHLTDWADDVVLVVTAGRSRVTLIRTAGDLIRSAGLRIRGIVLLRAEPDDDSSGMLRSVEAADGSVGGTATSPGAGTAAVVGPFPTPA